MRIKSPDPQPRDDGEFHVYVNGQAYGKPYGIIYLDEGKALALRDITLSDARRLAAAVARVERELAAACAEMAAPHGRGHLYEGTCQLCGKPEDDGLHAEEPAVNHRLSADGAQVLLSPPAGEDVLHGEEPSDA